MSILEGSSPISHNQSNPEEARSQIMKDDFLKLLIAQLQHQDPLNPMEAVEFTSQLSQLAQLEQMFQINDNLNNLRLYQTSLNNMQAANFIGTVVMARGDLVSLDGDEPVSVNYQLNGDAALVTIRILNNEDQVVRVIETEHQQEGSRWVQWDGNDGEGNSLPDGIYRFEVSATDLEGNSIEAEPMINGRVTGLSYELSGPVLSIGPLRVPLGDVYEIMEPRVENVEDAQDSNNEY
ncbi:MAG: flagellar hook assembly protein FlgD [Deltaproteobacteria bacterium]|nr:flagellar hook assembly protein FlgD [Deltaproteobacteria bacterium]MBW2307938.1 flagellar hook assembly protein FlgD [Deltaproteobacteria bacterium]